MTALSPRSYQCLTAASSWEELWEAGPYYDRVSELLEDAQHYVIIAGWQIDSRLRMRRPLRPGTPAGTPSHETLQEKILRLCAEKPNLQFYFLMWDHAYFYVAEREFWQGRIWDLHHPRFHFIFDNRHPLGGAHHEKTILVDGTVALCGGIDLCDERWDSPQHRFYDPQRSLSGREDHHGPYHDLSVQITGPVCRVLQKNLAYRWRSLSSIPFPEAAPKNLRHRGEPAQANRAVYVSRTQVDVDASKKMVREIQFLFRDLIKLAQRRLVLEGQYFWSRQITDMLVAKMHEMEGRPFELVIIVAELRSSLSLTRMMAAYEGRLLERLQLAAKQTGTQLTLGTPYSHADPSEAGPDGKTPEPRAVYVHSKLILVDDRFLCTGSANLNSRAMRIDTEINLTYEARTPAERARLRAVREKVLSHWGLNPSSPQSIPAHSEACGSVRLHPFVAGSRSIPALMRRAHQDAAKRYPYARLFDPLLPWGYALKRRFLLLSRRKPPIVASLVALLSVLATLTVLLLAGAPPGWSWLYAGLLASSWLFPVPFFLTSLLAALHLGGELGAKISVYALWASALIGYLASRMFPSFARRVLGSILPEHHQSMGQRQFEGLLQSLANPRINFRSKILAQGLYCMPLPWFLLSMGLLMPSVYWTALRWADTVVPSSWLSALRAHPAGGIAFLLLWTAISGLREAGAHARRSRRSPPQTGPSVSDAEQSRRKASHHAA